MPIHLQKEVEKLKKMLLALSTMVEESVIKSVKALEERDIKLAETIITADQEIDRNEVDVEEECLKILALYQPVAIDLRFIIAILKMNNDLERIADLAVNIAERAIFLSNEPKMDIPFNFKEMTKKVQDMLKNSIDSLVNFDPQLAIKVCFNDNEVDDINRNMYKKIHDHSQKNPERFDSFMHYLVVCRNLERIADHATNIAEDVLYMIEGEIVRHKKIAKE